VLKTWRKRRACFHHNHRTGESWIKSMLIDMGSRKLFWCDECGRTWMP
jgi:hypothetical protein